VVRKAFGGLFLWPFLYHFSEGWLHWLSRQKLAIYGGSLTGPPVWSEIKRGCEVAKIRRAANCRRTLFLPLVGWRPGRGAFWPAVFREGRRELTYIETHFPSVQKFRVLRRPPAGCAGQTLRKSLAQKDFPGGRLVGDFRRVPLTVQSIMATEKAPGSEKKVRPSRYLRGSGGFCPGPSLQLPIVTTHTDNPVRVSFVCTAGPGALGP
jgi:hypothetical protein